MKYTLFLTGRCNLACGYCYVARADRTMSRETAGRIIDFAFRNTPPDEKIDIGFFGGEPLLEFPLIRELTAAIEARPDFDPRRVRLDTVSNGTLLTEEMATFFRRHRIGLTLSCDGPPRVHDAFRRTADGIGSSEAVERAIGLALRVLGRVPVNAVYRPETLAALPDTVQYFSLLGVRQIYLNPDFSAQWTQTDCARLPEVYSAVAELYMRYYRRGRPHFVSLIDGKIMVMLRGGYQPLERCRMGGGEFAFTAAGEVLPCERLAGADARLHSIGSTGGPIRPGPLQPRLAPGPPVNPQCVACAIRDYCMNWCGCSNYFMTGAYNRVGPFLCASERAALEAALRVFRTLEADLGPTFVDHVGGLAFAPSVEDPAEGGSARLSPPFIGRTSAPAASAAAAGLR